MHRKLSNLMAGKGGEATGIGIEIAVEDINLIIISRYVFLQHQVGYLRVFHRPVAIN